MSKDLKKILVTGASLLMFASVGAGINNVSNNNKVHADMPGVSRTLRRFDHTPGALEDQYNSSFNKALGGTINVPVRLHHARNYYRRGHVFTAIPNESTPGEIIKVDGHRVYSRSQLLARLHAHRHYRKHARKHYRRPVRKAHKHVRKARKATKKHSKLNKKSTKRARKHFVAVKKHIAKKAHHTLRTRKVTKKAPKDASKAYKKGFALGNYANSTPDDATGSSREAIALMSTPFNNSSAKGFMASATKQFRHGLGLAFGKKMSQQYNSRAKASATNAMNAWKLIWKNRNNPKFLMGMKANLGAYGDNEAVYMDPSMRQYQNDSSFKAGYLAGDDFTDGSSANNSQNDKIYSNYVNDYNPALDQHYNY